MQQAIIDNQNFIYYLFNLTAGALGGLSLVTTLSYQFWNIFIWFGLIPATWLYLIGRRTTPWINLLSVPIFIYMFGVHTWIIWFDKAVILLNKIGRYIHYDYRVTSVIICVFAPALVCLLLLKLCTSPRTFKRFLIISAVLTGLVILLFPISNLWLKYYFGKIL